MARRFMAKPNPIVLEIRVGRKTDKQPDIRTGSRQAGRYTQAGRQIHTDRQTTYIRDKQTADRPRSR